MGQIIPYLLRVNIIIAVLFSLYWLLVRNKSNFKLNRIYLLSVLLFAFLFPLISFPVEIEEFANTNQFNFINTVNDFTSFPNTVAIETKIPETPVDMQLILSYAYLLITFLLLLRFIIELIRIIKKIYAYDKIKKERFTLIVNKNFKSPFSFFHYIFVEKFPGVDSLIIEHEKVHARQLHTLDLFFTQISSALLWINPFIYLLKKELVAQHEYLADYAVLNNGTNHEKYLNQVLNQAQNNFNSALVSKFNYSLTIKRLKMMKNINLKQKRHFKYFVLFITTGIIAGLFACSNSDNIYLDKIKVTDMPVVEKITTDSIKVTKQNTTPSIWPIDKNKVKGIIKFGKKIHPILKVEKLHTGIDLKAERGTEIFATADGVAKRVEYSKGYGNIVEIEHDKTYSTLYAHLKGFNVKKGDQVKQGDVIGYVGSTGLSTAPHLHYEVRENGRWANPENYIPTR